jgi:hypothetical protein
MKIGGNSPTQGFTDRGQQAAEAFGPGVMLWLDSAEPANALRYPDCLHVLRCRNWLPGMAPHVYVSLITPLVTRWRSAIPAIIVQLGNEPDLEVGHSGEAIAQYADAVHAAFPGIKVGNPPLSVEGTGTMVAAGCDVLCCHSYIDWHYPETLSNPTFGQSYRKALFLTAGRPVYVTEIGISNFDGVHWTERNRLLARWTDQAEADGVAGACFFILDGQGEWTSFDVGPEAAAEILSLRVPAPAPSPPPESPMTGYSGQSRPVNGVTTTHLNWYARAPALVAAAYETNAPKIGYDPNLALAQSANETGWWTSPAFVNRRNMAGVGITGDNVLGPTWDTVEQGVQAHLALLNCYFGDGTDPWGQLTRFGFGGFTLSKHVLNDMNGVWAVPGGTYGDIIAGIANDVTGGVSPPVVDPGASTGIPLAHVLDIARAHIGHALTDEGNPEFGMCEQFVEEVLEQAIPAVPRVRWPTAAAHGDALIAARALDPITPPPAGSVVVWGRAFDPQGHIAIADEYPYVVTTYRDSDPATTDVISRIDGTHWYQSAGFLGWYVPEGATIQEDEALFTVDGKIDDGRLDAAWFGTDAPTKTAKKNMPRVKGHGIPDRWEAEFRAGRNLGPVRTKEKPADNTGAKIQYFTSGWIVWYPADGSTTVC